MCSCCRANHHGFFLFSLDSSWPFLSSQQLAYQMRLVVGALLLVDSLTREQQKFSRDPHYVFAGLVLGNVLLSYSYLSKLVFAGMVVLRRQAAHGPTLKIEPLIFRASVLNNTVHLQSLTEKCLLTVNIYAILNRHKICSGAYTHSHT